MANIKFVLPELSQNDMDINSQKEILVNQATAVIVTAFLKYQKACYKVSQDNDFKTEKSDLDNIINNVQNALKSF